MTTPTITCDDCGDEIDTGQDTNCVIYDPSGQTDVMCAECRGRAFDRWQARSLADWPLSDTEKLREAYKLKHGWRN
jgi:hypothetical protein